MSQGYRSPLYAQALAEFGSPLLLPRCGGWLLERAVEPGARKDATGPYPLFACDNWSKLCDDIEALRERLVSVCLVTDPFAEISEARLAACFERVVRFKEHFIVELHRPPSVSQHHRYHARRALRSIRVVRGDVSGTAALDKWAPLYANLVRRHDLRGIRAFSRESFAKQLQIPGMVMLEAWHQGRVVAAHLWFIDGPLGYSHLMAQSEEGYAQLAGYALYWAAVICTAEMLGATVTRLTLGAGAGLGPAADDGLSRFKRGWANARLPVYFCGKVLDPQAYAQLTAASGHTDTPYFPAYRAGEFG